jgi:hypothetical protein
MRFCLLVGVLSVTLAGCAGSPPARYYTLRAPIDSTPVAVTAVDYLIEVLPVSVPAQVDQPQIMLRFGPGTVLPLSSDRWVAPLGEELQVALSDVLKRELPALDVHALRFPQPRAAVWRIELDVQRFDMVAQQAAIIDATWRIRSMNTSGQTLLCRSLVTLPTQDTGIAPLVAAQQRAIGLLGATIAAAIRAGGHLRSEAALPAVQNLGCVEQG